ncbi:glycosyltransferase family 4 protein [soil metagenome]
MIPILLFLAAAAVSFALTHAVRRYAADRDIIDVPNHRSLHDRPVPRGGGLAIAATFLAGMVLLTLFRALPVELMIALLGGLLVAFIGWRDDHRGVSRRTRALVHFAAAAWVLWWLGGMNALSFGATEFALPVIGNVLAAAGIVWWINLYNFMDGIDGLAGGQAVTVAAAAGVLMLLTGARPEMAWPAFLLAGSAAGFLVLNWSPARIFMGDVGSGFLGFVFATLAVATENAGALPLVVWLLLSGVFLFDSTVTLLRRAVRGEIWYEAHRTHAYQRLVTAGRSHAAVTTGILGVNAVLAVVAYHAASERNVAVVAAAAALALALLAGLYLWVEHLQPMPAPPTQDRTPGDAMADSKTRS